MKIKAFKKKRFEMAFTQYLQFAPRRHYSVYFVYYIFPGITSGVKFFLNATVSFFI